MLRYNNLLLDIDGTIVGTNNSPIGHNPKLASILIQYMQKKGKVGLVTGRSSVYSSAVYEIFGLNGPRIIERGTEIITPKGKRIFLNELQQKSEIRLLLKKLKIYKKMVEEPKRFIITLLLPEFPYHNPKKLEEIYEKIFPEIKDKFLDVEITYTSHSIDIFNPNTDKGRAIKRYAKEMNLSLEDFAIVGDSIGDFPGFKVIGEVGGLVGYVGFDEDIIKKVKQFKNYYISIEKRSSGLVEIVNSLISE